MTGGAIIDYAQGKCYAISSGLTLTAHSVEQVNEADQKVKSKVDEIQVLKTLIDKEGMVPSPPGIWINGKTYYLITFRDDINTAYLMCNKGGACVTKTNKLILLGTWEEDNKQTAGDCNEAMEVFANNFLKINY